MYSRSEILGKNEIDSFFNNTLDSRNPPEILKLHKLIIKYQNNINALCKIFDGIHSIKSKLEDDGFTRKYLLKHVVLSMLSLLEKSNNIEQIKLKFMNEFLMEIHNMDPVKYDNILANALPSLLSDNFELFSKTNFSVCKSKTEKVRLSDTFTLVCAHNGEAINSNNPSCIQGNMFEDDHPQVGYSLFLPNDFKPKALAIWVYGGNNLNQAAILPENPSDLDRALLIEGIAVAYLITSERRQLMWGYQTEMSDSTQNDVHKTIHSFISTVRSNPDILHEKLGVLRDKPCYVIGHSFGGRTAFRHGQYYPEDIDGVISINGGLSFSKLIKHGNKYFAKRWTDTAQKAKFWLSPHYHVTTLEKRALIVQNASDNNATIYNALDFKKHSSKHNPDTELFIFNEIISGFDGISHGIPKKNNQSFGTLAKKVVAFIFNQTIEKGISPEHIDLELAYLYPNKNIIKRFISAIYQVYPNDFNQDYTFEWNGEIDKYLPILAAIYYIDKIKQVTNNFIQEDMDNSKLQENELEDLFKIIMKKFMFFILSFKKLPEPSQPVSQIINAMNSSRKNFLDIIIKNCDFFNQNRESFFVQDLYLFLPRLVPDSVLYDKEFVELTQKITEYFDKVYSRNSEELTTTPSPGH